MAARFTPAVWVIWREVAPDRPSRRTHSRAASNRACRVVDSFIRSYDSAMRSDLTVIDPADFRAEPLGPGPWCPLEVPRAQMIHRWDLLTFLHWSYEPAEVAALLPDGLEVETFGGRAWVGLVPFAMLVRPPRIPAVPWMSRFCETNVRTYVRGPRRHGRGLVPVTRRRPPGAGGGGPPALPPAVLLVIHGLGGQRPGRVLPVAAALARAGRRLVPSGGRGGRTLQSLRAERAATGSARCRSSPERSTGSATSWPVTNPGRCTGPDSSTSTRT